MNIAQREQQILRIKAQSFQAELDAALEQTLQFCRKNFLKRRNDLN
jgi:hypothetical protein